MLLNFIFQTQCAVVTKEHFLQRGNFCACQAIFSIEWQQGWTSGSMFCLNGSRSTICLQKTFYIDCLCAQSNTPRGCPIPTDPWYSGLHLFGYAIWVYIFFQGGFEIEAFTKKFNTSLPLIYFPWSVWSVLIHLYGQLTFTKKKHIRIVGDRGIIIISWYL